MLQIILATPGVITTHKLRSRYLGPAAVAADMHILVDGSISVTDGHAIAARVKYRLLDSQLPLVDVVVHIEPATNTGSSRHSRRPGDTESQKKPPAAD
jgi:divalent metal cation (Fe/Co/Zn/Cd) transporter